MGPEWPDEDEAGLRKLSPVMTSKLLMTASPLGSQGRGQISGVMSEVDNITVILSIIYFPKVTRYWISCVLSILDVHSAGRAGRGLITNITTVHDKPALAPALTVTLRLVLTISRVKSRVLALTQLSHLICCSLYDAAVQVQENSEIWRDEHSVISASCSKEVICPVIDSKSES